MKSKKIHRRNKAAACKSKEDTLCLQNYPWSFEAQLDGMVLLRLSAVHTESVLQLLAAQEIPLYRVQRTVCYVYFTIRLDDFTAVQHILREQHMRFHISAKYGLPFLISKIKRRKGLWVGALFSVAIGYLLLSFLWGYEVTGNERYSDAQIIALVQEYGLNPGSRLDSFDYDALEYAIELAHPEFTWMQLQPRGTTLYISVKERLIEETDLDVLVDNTGSIIAKTDGTITELLVYRGTALVERGDYVKAGQVLIGGWEYPDRVRNASGVFVNAGQPYAVRAKGVVSGQTERRAIATCALQEKWLQLTGKKDKYTVLLWQEHQLLAFGAKESPYLYSTNRVAYKNLFRWGNLQSPLCLKTVTYEEKILMQRSYTSNDAYQVAVERARRQLQTQLPQTATFVRESSGVHRTTEDGMIQAEVVWIVEEPIGQLQQVALPEENIIENPMK